MPKSAAQVVATPRQKEILERLAHTPSTPQQLAQRCHIVLMSSEPISNIKQARRLAVDRQKVRRWRKRFAQHQQRLAQAEASADDKELKEALIAVLSDAPRCGAPATFTPAAIAQLIALACTSPAESQLPITRWTGEDLARQAQEMGIVPSISPRHVNRILAEAEIRPHKSRYWMTSPDKQEDPERYQQQAEKVCEIYQSAPELERNGTHVISTDEKTGMQALERTHPTKSTQPGQIEGWEFEYIRHGTMGLIANLNVASGKVESPTLSPTRTETDFSTHIQRTIDQDPSAGWIFVVDNLNTHMSEELVRLVAQRCGVATNLGVKEGWGILESMETRRVFLEDPTHRIRFVYTPRHSSWLNQIELWFSILVRKLLRRLDVRSLDEFKDRVMAFIDHFNRVLAKPFRWTFTGRPLQA